MQGMCNKLRVHLSEQSFLANPLKDPTGTFEGSNPK